jgi:calreticulin
MVNALESDTEYQCGAIRTTTDNHFYAISSSELTEPFNNKGKDLVLQYTVRFSKPVGCGGGTIKVMPNGFDQKSLSSDTPHLIHFGPDICGGEKKLQLEIISGTDKAKWKKKYEPTEDANTHFYQLYIGSDNTYKIVVDSEEIGSGDIEKDFSFEIKAKIEDPKAIKPADWDDRPTIDDPNDKKPEGYDDIPAEIDDPAAEKPADWDDVHDGTWKAPKIKNPSFKGEWKPSKSLL